MSDAKANAVVDAHVIIDVVVDAAFVVDVHVIIDVVVDVAFVVDAHVIIDVVVTVAFVVDVLVIIEVVVDAHVIIDVVIVDVLVIIDGILMAMEEVRWPTTKLFISCATSNHFIQGIISFDMFLSSSSSPISSTSTTSSSSPISTASVSGKHFQTRHVNIQWFWDPLTPNC